jgi:hypothetical protein
MLTDCAGCKEPLFDNVAKCAKCGLGNPAYEPPHWHKIAFILPLVVVALGAGFVLGPIGWILVGIPAGAFMLRDKGIGIIALWAGGNVAVLGLTLLIFPMFIVYALLSVALLVPLSNMKK